MRKLIGTTLLLCALLCLVSMNLGMRGRLAGLKAADKLPFWLGMLVGVSFFLVPAYFLLRSPRSPDVEGDPAEGDPGA